MSTGPPFPEVTVPKPMPTLSVVTVTLSMTHVKLMSRGATEAMNGMKALTTEVLTKLSTNYGKVMAPPLASRILERPPLY